MKFALHLPINSVSFGQVSIGILRELYRQGEMEPPLFLVGDKAELGAQPHDQGFFDWVTRCFNKKLEAHNRNTPIFKLWHFNGSLDSYSKKQILLTFYELDSPTKTEINTAKNQDLLLVSSHYAKQVFSDFGVSSVDFVPLFFDSANFKRGDKTYFKDGRITFLLTGKFEKRKHHAKIIKAWIKRFGKDPRYFLQCAIFNPFLKAEDNQTLFSNIIGQDNIFNVDFLGYMQKNSLYNDYLNSGDIIIGMSGGEGWGLPEFHCVGLGKYGIILNAHAYKEWADEKNSILVPPSGKVDSEDGIFFQKGNIWNQGNIFDWSEDEFIAACEKAIEMHKANPINEEGLKLQEKFTVKNTTNKILEYIEKVNNT